MNLLLNDKGDSAEVSNFLKVERSSTHFIYFAIAVADSAAIQYMNLTSCRRLPSTYAISDDVTGPKTSG